MSIEKQTENEELFSILSNTINGANYDDLNEAVYKILGIANYHKQGKGGGIYQEYSMGHYVGKCSICGCEADMSKFCPNCGAKMKGE